MNKRVSIYYRVSTKEQSIDMQMTDLRNYVKIRGFQLVGEYIDIASGSKNDRENYQKLRNDVFKRKTDIVLVWRFDRISRSVKELVTLLEEFQGLGIDFISYNENIDTSTPAGKVLFTIISSFAEFERAIIRERVKSGIEKAKMKGKRLGRPPVENSIKERVRELAGKGFDYKFITNELGISKSKYYQLIH